jgi:two-component system cell cycle response regulator
MRLFDELGVGSIVYSSIDEFQTHLSISIPDLISINPNLSIENGLNLFRLIRENEKLKTVPIIAITSSEYRELMVQCLRCGSNDFLEKPFTKEEFQARIENLLRIKRLQDELVQKYQILEDLAFHDALTGLLNRRYLDEGLPREIDRATRTKASLGLMLVDLDHFKKVNDTYGHEVGDWILRDIANLVKHNVRNIDIPCRYGGEELCVLLPGCSLEQATRVAEHVRFCCDNSVFTTYKIDQKLSIGVSAYPTPSSAAKLITDADSALYQAKKMAEIE